MDTPKNPADSPGLSDLGPAQPTRPAAPQGLEPEQRNPPSPAAVPVPESTGGQTSGEPHRE